MEHTMMMSDQTSSWQHLFWNNITDSLSISHTNIKAQDFLHEHRSSFRVIIETSWVIIQSLWKHASRKVSAIAPLTTDVMPRTIYILAQGCRLGTTSSIWNCGHCAAYFIQCICPIMSDDKDSITHVIVAEFCEEGDPGATGLSSGEMN